MALTRLPPVNYGGGELGAGIASGIQSIGKGIAYGIEKRGDEQEKRKKLFYDTITDVDTYSAVFDRNRKTYNDLAMEFDEVTQKISERKKANITSQDVLEVMTIKGRINNKIAQMKQEEAFITKQREVIFKDSKGIWDREEFEKGLQEYNQGGELKNLLVQAERDAESHYSKLKIWDTPNDDYEIEKDGKYINVKSWGDMPTREGRVMNDFITQEGLRRNMVRRYNELDEEQKQSYIKQATQQIDAGKNLIMPDKKPQSPEEKESMIKSQAAMLYNVDTLPKYIQPPIYPSTLDKRKDKGVEVIEELGGSYQMYDNPVKLTGYKGVKTTNVVELLKGPPREDMPMGMYFKVFKTSPEADKVLEKMGGGSFAMLARILKPDQYKIDYIPYNEIAGMVEKKYKFKGIDQFLKGGNNLTKINW